jgi:uncharacterized membrane protein
MADQISQTSHGDAPLATAKNLHPDGIAHLRLEAGKGNELVARTVTINRSRAELYAFWRDFRNLPRFMHNIQSVSVTDDVHSHWVVLAPAGQTVEWESIVTEDQPERVIAWSSVEGSGVQNTGRVDFRDAPGGRGTEVTATIAYAPPAGGLGKIVAKLFQREPKVQARQDLRRFKQLMEAGEISTAQPPDAAPRA